MTSRTSEPASAARGSRREPGTRDAAATFETAIFWIFVAAVAWAPFWFGGNRPLAWGVNALLYPLILVAYDLGLLVLRRPYPVHPARIAVPILCLVVCVAWVAVQLVAPAPFGAEHPIWPLAADVLGEPIAGTITIDPSATREAILRLLPAPACLWLALQLCRDERRARLFVFALGLIGGLYAFYGLVAFFAPAPQILWFEKIAYLDSLTATFVNRNNFATYAGITLLAALGTVVGTRAAGSGGSRWWALLADAAVALTGRAGIALVAALAIAIALVLSGSRAGIGATVAGVVLFWMIFLGRGGNRAAKIWVVVLGLVAFALVAANFGALLFTRIGDTGFEDAGRGGIYARTVAAIADFPLTGIGYGAFESAFRIYRDASVVPAGVVDKAHDTYLEAALGLGLPVTAVALVGYLALFRRMLSGALGRRYGWVIPAVGAAATVLVGVHALVDFSMQIQGVEITWAALAGAAVAQSWSSRVDTTRASGGEPARKPAAETRTADASSP